VTAPSRQAFGLPAFHGDPLNENRRPLTPALSATAVLVALAGITGCSSVSDALTPAKVDYRTGATKTTTLEVPPDLTQLVNDPRYQAPSGSAVSANAMQSTTPGARTDSGATPLIAPQQVGSLHIERAGTQRWLVTPLSAEQLWPVLHSFWQEQGFTLEREQPELGVMETDWMENRAKIPQDIIRRTIGKVFSGLYDSGLRDRYRTRVERTANGTEVYITHRGAEEIYTSERKDQTVWQVRPADPNLEAEMLARLMLKLGAPEQAAEQAKAEAAKGVNAPSPSGEALPARARLVTDAPGAALRVDDGFERAWRRVGSALDRTGFTVEDRDRAQGVYFVRYVDPKLAGKEDPGFFARLFGAKKAEGTAGERLRIQVKGENPTSTLVSVQDTQGVPQKSDSAGNIVRLLVNELK
jgi:outer membrane protein assembly factor BamC